MRKFSKEEMMVAEARLTPHLLDQNGRIKLYPFEFYKRFALKDIWVWCWTHARYLLPTIELVDFLKDQIGDRKAIEIGTGNSDLYWHLDILGTDPGLQADTQEVAMQFAAMGQPVNQPPPDVVRMDAAEAIEHYKPDVVIGSWITQYFFPAYKDKRGNMNGYGVHEDKLIKQADYIFIGNSKTHGSKKILRTNHLTYYKQQLGIVSRAEFPNRDICWVWSR